MTAELKEIGGKLDLAKRTLDAMAELMDQIAGRTMDTGMIERLIARGRKVDI